MHILIGPEMPLS